jgi:hypothetical protein
MEQSPSWEAESSSASQGIPRLLLNPKAYYYGLYPEPLDPV